MEFSSSLKTFVQNELHLISSSKIFFFNLFYKSISRHFNILVGYYRSFALLAQDKVEDTWLCARTVTLRDINALAECHHQRIEEALLFLLVVVFTKQWLDCLGGPLSVVERNAAEQVVDDMVIDDFVEEVAANEASCAIDSSQCALSVGPGLGSIVGNSGVGVLKIGDSNCGSG